MKKWSIIFVHAFFTLMLLNTSLNPYSGVHAEVLTGKGCGKVFGLIIQGDGRKDFKIDVDKMVGVIKTDLGGTVREYRPPAEGEGIADAAGEIRGSLSELMTGMGPDDTLIVSIHTHGCDFKTGGRAGFGTGALKLELGYDENGHRQFSKIWKPAADLPWSEIKAGKILINVDTCFAEAAAMDLKRVLSGAAFADKEILILAAASIDETAGAGSAGAGERPGGFFTNALVDEMYERGIYYLALPSAVAGAYEDIAARARASSIKSEWVSNFEEQRIGINPRSFSINISIIEKIDPKTAVIGHEVVIRGRHFGYPLSEGEYQNDPNEDIQVFFCQTQSSSTPQPCYRGLAAEIVRRTNTQIVVEVPEEFDTTLSNHQPVYVCIDHKGKLTSSLFLGTEGEFTLQYPPEIAAISPDVVLMGSYFGVRGKHFGDRSLAILDDTFTIQPSWVNEDYMLVHLPPPNTIGFIDGAHTLKVRLGTAESESAPFTVVLQHAPGEERPMGWTITVSELTMTDAADGEISLLEAMKLANGTLGREPQKHENCEITGDCPWRQREEDFISGYPGPGGTGFKDTVLVESDLSGGSLAAGGTGLPHVDHSDQMDFKNIVIDGAGSPAGAHGLFLDQVSNAKIRNVTLRNFGGDGIHIQNHSTNNEFSKVNIDSAVGHGICVDGHSVQNTFTYPDQDPFDTFVPNIYNTGGHGIYLKGGANRNTFRNVFIADVDGTGIFLEGHAEGNHLDKMVIKSPALHGLHLSGSLVRLNRAYRHKTGKLSDLEAAWDLEDIYETAGGYGILIDKGANNNIIGPNQVYKNTQGGIRLDGADTEFNVVGKAYRNRPFNEGAILPALVYDNLGHGIHLSNGASFNTIELLNVAGNSGDGVLIEGSNTEWNRISGIWTGFFYFYKELTAPLSKPNTGNGVHIKSGAGWNTVGGYSIVRNNFANDALNGVLIEGAETHHNIVHHTDIGRTPYITRIAEGNVFGRKLAGVGKSGIAVTGGAHDNTIGSMDTEWRVHVDASPDAGILIDASDDNLVLGCFLGSPFEYIEFEEHEKNRIGIHIRNQAEGNRVGRIGPMLGPDPNPAGWTGIVDHLNHITHAREAGLWIENAGGSVDKGNRVHPNVLHNNYIESDGIGVLISGTSRVNDIGGWLGGPTGDFVNVYESFTQENNTIQGQVAGIKIVDVQITHPDERNRILHNTINSQWDEQDPPSPIELSTGPPDGVGILLAGTSSGNIIGESAEAPNRIHMNRVGVYIDGASDNTVRGNRIGSLWVPNSISGIVIRNGGGNRIGGRLFEESNMLEGNGLLAYGINGPTANPLASGILILGGEKNTVQGNEIVDTSGDGIRLISTAGNTIGGPKSLSGNVITHSSGNGIAIQGVDSTDNTIQNNLIGMNWQGEAQGNHADGIAITGGASGNLIGGKGSITVAGKTVELYAPNTIANNTITGIHVSGSDTIGNAILYNSIHGNMASGISNVNAGNDELPPPANMRYELGRIVGEVNDVSVVPAGSVVNVFWDAESQGEVFLGETRVETNGTWSLSGILPAPFWLAGHFTATVTHASTGSTSAYAVASAGWDRAFNLFRADGRAPGRQSVAFGHGDIPVLVLGVIAAEEGVQVNRLTLASAGSLLDDTQLDGVSIYLDDDRNGRLTHDDQRMAGPFVYNADNGEVDLNLSGIIVEANDAQQWIIVYHTNRAVEESTTFSAWIADALAVDAVFTSSQTAAVPQGPFPAASDQFTVVLAKKFTLADLILILQMLSGLEPAFVIDTDEDINHDGKIGLHEAIWALQELSGMRVQAF